MNEFGATPSAKLTIDEFMRIDLEAEYDPPSFLKSQADHEFKITENDIEFIQAQGVLVRICLIVINDLIMNQLLTKIWS